MSETTIKTIINEIEHFAPPKFQENYDNARLIVGDSNQNCTGVLLSLDSTEEVVEEAIEKDCNFIIAHHPIVFKGLKSITGANYVERTVIKAIKNDIAIYACHTNMDNVWKGVNQKICEKIGLENTKILLPKTNTLCHLITFVPHAHLENVREALFKAGAGNIGNYDSCSFNLQGMGTYRGNEDANPSIGEKGHIHTEPETRLEVILPIHLKQQVISVLKSSHPYEEVAYYMHEIVNDNQEIGSGMIGELHEEMDELQFLTELKEKMNTAIIKYTNLSGKKIKRVAVCGGAGSFLLSNAISANADIFITADVKYHEFFDADGKLIIADIGHFESEQFTNEIFAEIINKKFRNFAVHFSTTKTNPINYL